MHPLLGRLLPVRQLMPLRGINDVRVLSHSHSHQSGAGGQCVHGCELHRAEHPDRLWELWQLRWRGGEAGTEWHHVLHTQAGG